MPRSPTLGLPTPQPARTSAMRRGLLATAVIAVGVLAAAIGWVAAGPLTNPPHPTVAPAVPFTTVAPSAAPTTAATPTPAPGRMWSVVVTFYGAADNDPPGSTEIAHPNARHRAAGGTGTYADPVSLAADPRAIKVGTRIYYPPLRKYFVMEDDCVACINDWQSARIPHIDLWTGNYTGEGIISCEEALTPDGRKAVELNPPPGRPVDPRPLYSAKGCPG
jgi:3D (Asp-Asp-Asp) domain-containing protein